VIGYVSTTERYARNNPEVIKNAVKKASSDLLDNTVYYDDNEKSKLLDYLKTLQ